MEVVKKYWLAGNIDLTLKEIRQILGRKDAGSIPHTDALLLFASIDYQLGNLQYAAELLDKVKFDLFDVKRWIVENNLLVVKYLESKSLEDQKAIALSFGLLHEKIGGLPFADVCLLELNVCLNHALVIFCSNSQQALVPGGYNVSQAALLTTLERILCASPSESVYQGYNQYIEEKLQFYLRNGREQKQEQFLVSTLVWLLASNFLVNCRVTEAQKLMDIVLDLYIPNNSITVQRKTNLIFTFLADAGKFQDFLIPACHLAQSYAAFILNKKTRSLKHCDLCLSLQPEFICGLFLKGLLFYESGKHEDAIEYLQQVVTLSNDNGYKATALNLLGCICATLRKPHTALLKFRESFACHSGHLESLHNVAVVYHDSGEFELEISMWKYILKILSLQRARHDPDTALKMNVDYVCGIAARALDDSISEDYFFISTDINCVKRCDVRNSKLSIPSVLFKIAQNCLLLKRYSEASEFYGQLLAQLNDKPVDVNECRIPSLSVLYKDFADVLFKCGSWDDCLVVCEKILNQEIESKTVSKALFSQDNVKLNKGKTIIKIMLCKAAVLKELQRPIEANECYESILDTINNSVNESCAMETDLDEPKLKRQKREKGDPHEDVDEVQKLTSLTLNNQSLLLSSLGRNKEALLLLTQCISCQPDCLKYHYNHTRLLFDMGMEDEAARDWLKFRRNVQIPNTSAGDENFKLKDLPEDDEDRDLYIEMDSDTISRLSKKS